MMLDLIISGGKIYDGCGGAPYLSDIGIKDERIVEIGNLSGNESKEMIPADGFSVLPGFIDVHTHSDAQLLWKPSRTEALCQGITTEITGACGIGLFPLPENGAEYTRTVSGLYGSLAPHFNSCAEYLEALPPTGVNVAVQVAHSPLRYMLNGFQDKPLPEKEMLRLARRAFEEGACALSTGLAYYPASFGNTDEVIALCKIAAEFDAPICVHQRTALRKADPNFNSREEVLEFAKKSGIRIQYSHYRPTPETAGNVQILLEPIERGLSEGLHVTADFYPYPVGAGYLAVFLPMWSMTGGFRDIMKRLRRTDTRKKIQREQPDLSRIVILHAPKHPEYWNRTLSSIAEERGENIPDTALNLLVEENLEVAYRPGMDFTEESLEKLDSDFIELMKKPYYMFGSDTLPGMNHPHPRTFGAFARMLRLTVKNKVNPAVFANRASALPAKIFGLKQRGTIKKGNFADLCVFKPEEIKERSTFENPFEYAEGMKYVLVNGQAAVSNGKITGVLAGKPIRRNLWI